MEASDNFLSSEKLYLTRESFKDIKILFANMGGIRFLLPFCLIINLIAAALPAFFRWYMAKLVDCDLAQCTNVESPFLAFWVPVSVPFFLSLTFAAAITRVVSWVLFEVPGQLSTISIHNKMTQSLLTTRTTYFDENPSGRIINRLIKDFDFVRLDLIIWSGDFLNASLELIMSALLLCFISPWLFLLVPTLFAVFFYFQQNIAAILKIIKQYKSHAYSYLLHRYTDLLDGNEIFTLYGKLDSLQKRIKTSLDDYAHTALFYARVESWGSLWLALSGEIYAFVVFLFLVFAVNHGLLDVALTGTIISAVFGLASVLGWLNFATNNLAASLVHSKRVFEILDLPHETLEEKDTAFSGGGVLPHPHCKSLPREVLDIRFENYSMAYRKNSPIILKEFSAVIPARKKTALIGRSGAGKTSIMQALMRMVYVKSGDIKLGDESIYSYDVTQFRGLFGIIPQQPSLFSGTIRENLDRMNILSDAVLSEYLAMAELKIDLHTRVREGGANFSPGERQLLAIIRVIASNKPYLFLDEPTSSIDPQTDMRISRLLDRYCQGKTQVIIAHRTETIANADVRIEVG